MPEILAGLTTTDQNQTAAGTGPAARSGGRRGHGRGPGPAGGRARSQGGGATSASTVLITACVRTRCGSLPLAAAVITSAARTLAASERRRRCRPVHLTIGFSSKRAGGLRSPWFLPMAPGVGYPSPVLPPPRAHHLLPMGPEHA